MSIQNTLTAFIRPNHLPTYASSPAQLSGPLMPFIIVPLLCYFGSFIIVVIVRNNCLILHLPTMIHVLERFRLQLFVIN